MYAPSSQWKTNCALRSANASARSRSKAAAALRLVQESANDQPEIVGDFRLFNRYVIQKRPKRPVQGRCRRKQPPPFTQEEIDVPAGESRLSAAIALDRIYREAA
jgi:hypothetical protein